MKRNDADKRFAARPSAPDDCVKQADRTSKRGQGNADYTAWLTVDITPELPGCIKIAAFQRGVTVAEMLRELLVRTYPESGGAPQ